MPRVHIKTNIFLSKQKKRNIFDEVKKVVDAVPYENGEFVLADFDDEASVMFGADPGEASLILEFYVLDKVYQKVEADIWEKALFLMTEIVCQESGISPSRCYAYICQVPIWSYEGKNIEKGLLKLDE